MAQARIIDQETDLQLETGDYVLVDSLDEGTRKFDLGGHIESTGEAISGLSNKIGDATMGTTATTITGAIAEHEGDISSLSSSLTNYIVANNYTFPSAVSIGANNTYTNTDVDVSGVVPAGYTPVFAYCRATGENSISCYQCGMYNIANKKAVIQLRNISASALNVTPVITVVSVKS